MKSPAYDPAAFDQIIDAAFALDVEQPSALDVEEPRVLGDVAGHDFHGNQWTGGGGAEVHPGQKVTGSPAAQAAVARTLAKLPTAVKDDAGRMTIHAVPADQVAERVVAYVAEHYDFVPPPEARAMADRDRQVLITAMSDDEKLVDAYAHMMTDRITEWVDEANTQAPSLASENAFVESARQLFDVSASLSNPLAFAVEQTMETDFAHALYKRWGWSEPAVHKGTHRAAGARGAKSLPPLVILMADGTTQYYTKDGLRVLGGSGSGNFGHSGRPGEIGGSGDQTGAGDYADFERQAVANLERTSRTATGVSDTSSSDSKPKLTVEGAGLAQKSKENFTGAMRMAWSAKDAQFHTPDDVLKLTEQIAGKVSDGLLQPGQGLYRTWATKNDQLDPAKIPAAMKELTTELHARLQDPAKAVETAAWMEKSLAHIHPWADGVGRTTKVLSALVLARGGVKLPVYPDTKTYYAQIQSPDWPRHFAEMIPR